MSHPIQQTPQRSPNNRIASPTKAFLPVPAALAQPVQLAPAERIRAVGQTLPEFDGIPQREFRGSDTVASSPIAKGAGLTTRDQPPALPQPEPLQIDQETSSMPQRIWKNVQRLWKTESSPPQESEPMISHPSQSEAPIQAKLEEPVRESDAALNAVSTATIGEKTEYSPAESPIDADIIDEVQSATPPALDLSGTSSPEQPVQARTAAAKEVPTGRLISAKGASSGPIKQPVQRSELNQNLTSSVDTAKALTIKGEVVPNVGSVQRAELPSMAGAGETPDVEPSSQTTESAEKDEKPDDESWNHLKRLVALHDMKAAGEDITPALQGKSAEKGTDAPVQSAPLSESIAERVPDVQQVQEIAEPSQETGEVTGTEEGSIGIQKTTDSPIQKEPHNPAEATPDLPLSPVQRSVDFANEGQAPNLEIPVGSAPPATPLEDAWPVEQVKELAEEKQNSIDQAVQRKAELPPVQPNEEATQINNQVEQILEGIGASRPSHSSVQVIPPRGSRPKAKPTGKGGTIQAKNKRDATGPIQKESILKFLGNEFGSKKEAATTIQKAPLEQSTNVGSSTAELTQSKPVEEQPLVETDVGPLPADLWTILGDTPPLTVANSDALASSIEPKQEIAKPISGTQTVNSVIQSNKVEARKQPDNPIVQRQEGASDVVPAPSTDPVNAVPSGNQTDAEQEESDSEEINLDELAQQVYKSLKKKLDVEWERRRLR